MCLIPVMMCLIMYFCMFGAIVEVNLNNVFFYLGNERFLHFFILTSILQ